MLKKFTVSLLLSLCCQFVLQAEVQKVTIKWTAMACKELCVQGLAKQFYLIKGVSNVQIDQGAGQAILTWKPDQIFTFAPINTAMSMIGLAINNIQIKVRGTVRHDDRTVTLVSIGDGTLFQLIGPVMPSPSQYVIQYNTGSRTLPPHLREELLEGEAGSQVAMIEGPLLMPERSPPLQLVIERLQFSKPQEE
ncbi:MAG: hypothetical protein H0X51_03705 [Parachlamydiaceae bacterium]|nr:hypothetical protein [Parachlamydiaceae bacterium]